MFNFSTEDRSEATASFLVYEIYRSRNRDRFKISKDMWSRIERFIKSSAKRAETIVDFMEKFKKKMNCESLKILDLSIFSGINEKEILKKLYKETTWIILLVRDRLAKEKEIDNEL